jgi:hypothetical protein
MAESGQGDGEGEFGAADVESGLMLVPDTATGHDPERLAQGVDVDHGHRL